jgi:prepilin-type N-terminal cleavage/methylation domain-containing protein
MTPPATRHSPVTLQQRQGGSLATGRRSAAFTLIELLVVIAIIAILAGLGFAGMQGAMESSKRAQARNDVNQIASAVKAYLLEYGRLPENGSVMATLTGGNPKKVVFLEAKNAKGDPPKGGLSQDRSAMYDPWGEEYVIELDDDYDNKVRNQLTTVIVETTAPDGKKINNVQ